MKAHKIVKFVSAIVNGGESKETVHEEKNFQNDKVIFWSEALSQ